MKLPWTVRFYRTDRGYPGWAMRYDSLWYSGAARTWPQAVRAVWRCLRCIPSFRRLVWTLLLFKLILLGYLWPL